MHSSRFRILFISLLLSVHSSSSNEASDLKPSSSVSSLTGLVTVASPFSGISSRATSVIPSPNFFTESPKPIFEDTAIAQESGLNSNTLAEQMEIDNSSSQPDFGDLNCTNIFTGDCSLKAISEHWEVETEDKLSIPKMRQKQIAFINKHLGPKGKQFFFSGESSTQRTYLGRFVFGKGFYGGDADFMNSGFQVFLFKVISEDFPAIYALRILLSEVVDFSYLVYDLQTNQFETYLTLLCLRAANNMDKLSLVIHSYPKGLLDQPNSMTATPLRIAVQTSNFELARELVSVGADMNDISSGRMSPFLMSMTLSDRRIYHYFISTGKFNLKTLGFYRTAPYLMPSHWLSNS